MEIKIYYNRKLIVRFSLSNLQKMYSNLIRNSGPRNDDLENRRGFHYAASYQIYWDGLLSPPRLKRATATTIYWPKTVWSVVLKILCWDTTFFYEHAFFRWLSKHSTILHWDLLGDIRCWTIKDFKHQPTPIIKDESKLY